MTSPDSTSTHLTALYRSYFNAPLPSDKATFYSTSCMQICRPDPSFAAKNADGIVAYLEAERTRSKPKDDPFKGRQAEPELQVHCNRCSYTIRPLTSDEMEFGSDEVCLPAGFTAEQMRVKAQREAWRGMRVDLVLGDGTGRVVEVRYWWRLEARDEGKDEWKQCLHDILYIGPQR